jgi:hypothetical protein
MTNFSADLFFITVLDDKTPIYSLQSGAECWLSSLGIKNQEDLPKIKEESFKNEKHNEANYGGFFSNALDILTHFVKYHNHMSALYQKCNKFTFYEFDKTERKFHNISKPFKAQTDEELKSIGVFVLFHVSRNASKGIKWPVTSRFPEYNIIEGQTFKYNPRKNSGSKDITGTERWLSYQNTKDTILETDSVSERILKAKSLMKTVLEQIMMFFEFKTKKSEIEALLQKVTINKVKFPPKNYKNSKESNKKAEYEKEIGADNKISDKIFEDDYTGTLKEIVDHEPCLYQFYFKHKDNANFLNENVKIKRKADDLQVSLLQIETKKIAKLNIGHAGETGQNGANDEKNKFGLTIEEYKKFIENSLAKFKGIENELKQKIVSDNQIQRALDPFLECLSKDIGRSIKGFYEYKDMIDILVSNKEKNA